MELGIIGLASFVAGALSFDGWMVVWGLEKRSQINNKAFNMLYVVHFESRRGPDMFVCS